MLFYFSLIMILIIIYGMITNKKMDTPFQLMGLFLLFFVFLLAISDKPKSTNTSNNSITNKISIIPPNPNK